MSKKKSKLTFKKALGVLIMFAASIVACFLCGTHLGQLWFGRFIDAATHQLLQDRAATFSVIAGFISFGGVLALALWIRLNDGRVWAFFLGSLVVAVAVGLGYSFANVYQL